MRITAPVTDYVRESIFTTAGDLAVRDGGLVERLAAGLAGTYLQGKGVATLPAYEKTMPPLTTLGDLITQGVAEPSRIPASTSGRVLTSQGAGNALVWWDLFNVLNTKGDLWVRGDSYPERLAAGDWGSVIVSAGAGNLLVYKHLFNLLTTKGDIWVRGDTDPVKLAVGLLDTYFKGQGAGELPIYEKLALRDTGVYMGTNTRNASGQQAISGVGFQPSAVIFLFGDDVITNMNGGVGADVVTVCGSVYIARSATQLATMTAYSIHVERDAGNIISARILTMDAGGFTLLWTLVGACVCDYVYLCLP